MKSKHVLVTGGTGIVGRCLIEELSARGAMVRASYRKEGTGSASRFQHPNIEWIEGDLQEDAFCEKLVKNIQVVIHAASFRKNVAAHHKDPEFFMKGNILMSETLTEAIRYEPSVERMIFMGTANIPPNLSLDEILHAEEPDGYVAGKAAAELLWSELSQERSIPLLILRPVGIYGAFDRFAEDSNAIPSLIYKAHTHKDELKLWGDGMQKRSFVFVDDVIKALFTLLENNVTGVQYIAPPEIVSIKELAEIIRDIVNPDLPIVCDTSKPTGQKELPAFPLHPILKNFPWVPLTEGLARTYEGWKKIL